MTKTKKLTTVAATAALAAALPAIAGPNPAPEVAAPAPSNNGDWCGHLKSIGQVYSNDDAAFIQSLKFFGRFQWNYAYIDGEGTDGESFHEGFDEIRRLRFGSEIKFLNGFKLKGNVNLIDDDARAGGGRSFAYQNWDELKLSYSKKNVAGFDKAGFTYGRHKVGMGHESHTSSKKLKTVERSALSNKIYDGRWTGFTLDLERGNWEGTIGWFSQDQTEALGSLSSGSSIYLSSAWELSCGNLLFDFFHNTDNEDDLVGYDWVASLAYDTQVGDWDLMVNVVYGDNGDSEYQSNPDREGNFYGIVIMPSTFIIEDKLEFAARYMYQASEEDEGIRAYSRYFRAGAHQGDVNSGRGDSHHSIYAGLNWYLCGQNSKVQVGVQYDTLDTPDGDASATTLWGAYRMYF